MDNFVANIKQTKEKYGMEIICTEMAFILIILFFVMINPYIINSSWISSGDLHFSIELTGAIVAVLAGIACFVYYSGVRDYYFFILGLGYFFAGSSGFVHGIISFERINSNLNKGYNALVPLTYIDGRVILALATILACVLGSRNYAKKLSKTEMILYCIIVDVLGAGITYILSKLPIPNLMFPDKIISRPADFVIGILFAAALFIVYEKYEENRDCFGSTLIASILFNMCGQFYMAFSKAVHDAAFDVAHAANVLSYLIPVFGITIHMIKRMNMINRRLQEREEMEQALKKSERRLREVTDHMLDFMCRTDKEGNMTYVSTSYCNVLGKNYRELKGKSILKYVHPEDFDRVEDFVTLDKLKFNSGTIEYRMKTKDDSYIWVETAGNLIYDENNLVSGAVFTTRDITERKKMEELQKSVEEERRIVNEVREYDRIKTEFFANISHELRTPINVIFSALQVMDLHITGCPFGSADTRASKYSKVMKQNCYRLLRLVNNLIDITKLDSGYLEISEKNYDIVSLVEDIVLSVAGYAEGKGLTLIFDTDIEEKIIACDPDKIERIIMNLLSNAVKFTGRGGNILVSLNDKVEHVLISVKDDGRGIPKEKLGTIFERFIQVDKSLARDHEGSGIGLSLVRSLVELHGGTIAADSEPGKGTEFIIELPCRTVQEEAVGTAEEIRQNYIERINIEFSDIYS